MITLLIRNIIYKLILFFNWVLPIKEHEVIVLCYHSVAKDNWRFSVAMEELEKQVEYLLQTRIPLSLPQLEQYLSGTSKLSKPSFIISFDDGYKDILKTRSFFKKHHIKPAVFVIADTQNANRIELETEKEFLTTSDIKQLKSDGWSIGSHSTTHADFGALSPSNIDYEVSDAKHTIKGDTGMSVEYFAYPKGKYNKKIVECVKIADYQLAFTMDDGRITVETDPHLIPRIGVDGTHGFTEFKAAITPLAIFCRGLVKKYLNRN